MMSLELAVLLDAPVRVRVGNACPTWKGAVQTESGISTEAYLKAVPSEQLLAEAFCAILGREAGLPVPPPYLVEDQGGFLGSEPEALGHTLFFGSGALEFPSFAHYLTENLPTEDERIYEILRRLAAWKHFHAAIAFDEWIANGDRHLDNLLYGGDDGITLIDHNHALGEPGWSVQGLEPARRTGNQLAEWLKFQGEVAMQTFRRALPTVMGGFARCPIDTAWDQAQSDRYAAAQWREMVIDFLEKRLPGLDAMLEGLLRDQGWMLR